ncbi:carboxylating nicotinate-nucleotide diphosphorylase [SAR202 cluster bacterium AC-409-J13_OGT_754m]|nr:carboxylating nicotinate-nucleotide diphosphorylase [SAR202 cluster bacterium AC-409-J13_OGT_754m]
MLITTETQRLIDLALDEDQVYNDLTTDSLIDPKVVGTARFISKQAGVLSGIYVASEVFRRIDHSIKLEIHIDDGNEVQPGSILAEVFGKAGTILRGERTALNFLQHMSGISTETSKYVNAIKDYKALVLDTRKTIPGFRMLDKYAVKMGGGENHRLNLADGILIKDNHIAILKDSNMNLSDIVNISRQNTITPNKTEIEVTNLSQLEDALLGNPDIILLDNMSIEDMRKSVKRVNGKLLLEASGNVTLENIASIAETGVDLISVGALTHSSKALDISLETEF